MIPSCDQTGTLHFHSSTTAGSACLISARTRASVSPRQSPSSSILASIMSEGDLPFGIGTFFMSLGLDVGDLRLLAVGLELRLDEFLEFRRRARRGESARIRDALEDALVLLGLAHFGG